MNESSEASNHDNSGSAVSNSNQSSPKAVQNEAVQEKHKVVDEEMLGPEPVAPTRAKPV